VLGLFILLVAMLLSAGPTPVILAETGDPNGISLCAPVTPCVEQTVEAATLSFVGASFRNTAIMAAGSVQSQPVSNGFGLAWAIMALLVVALLYALIAAVLVVMGQVAPSLPDAVTILIPILSVIGLGVAFYMTFIETRNVKAICGPVGDCNAVQSSPFAKLFGFFPVGLLGLIGYLGILAAWLLAKFGRGSLARLAPLALFGMALFGVVFTIYLTYLELFIIHAVCIWCLSSAVIMALLLALSVGPAMDALSEG